MLLIPSRGTPADFRRCAPLVLITFTTQLQGQASSLTWLFPFALICWKLGAAFSHTGARRVDIGLW